MSNLATALQSEIKRLARREAKALMEPLQQTIRKLRSEVRTLTAERQERGKIAKVNGRGSRAASAAQAESSPTTQRRWSADRLRAWRKKMKLTAAQLASLLGISEMTLYNWQSGATKPSPAMLDRIAAVKMMGRRELTAALKEREADSRR